MSDSAQVTSEFLSNSQQILDSLTRFHFVKLELTKERGEKNEWKTNYFTLNNQTVGCKNDLISEKRVVINVQTALNEKSRLFKNANTERWVHRILELGVGIYFSTKIKF